MPAIIGCVSQKGGVAKDTLSRALAVSAAHSGLHVDAVDMDVGQATLLEWSKDRAAAGLAPVIKVRLAHTAAAVLADAVPGADLIIVNGPARADETTWKLAQKVDLLVQPTGASLDDLRPAVRAFNALVEHGVPRSRLLLALSRIGSAAEASAAREYLEAGGYAVATGFVPERVSYRMLQNAGHAIVEARHPSLRAAAATVVQSIIDTAVASQKEEAAE